MTPSFQTARGKVGSLVYQYEIVPAATRCTKNSRLKDSNEAKAETYEFEWPSGGGKTEVRKDNYDQINQLFTDLMAKKAQLVTQQGEVDEPAKDAQDKLNDYVKEQVAGYERRRRSKVCGTACGRFKVDLRQINVNPSGTMINYLGGIGLVDRCQSCHIAMDPQVVPVTETITKADLGMAKSNDAPFTTHPDQELFKWHPLRAIWLLAMPRRQWPRAGFGRESPRPLRALAMAAELSGKLQRGLPELPRFGHGDRARDGAESMAGSCIARAAASAATSTRDSTMKRTGSTAMRQQITQLESTEG